MKSKLPHNISTRMLVKKYFDKCAKQGRRPTIRETAKAIGIVSSNTVHYHMKALGIPPRVKRYGSKYGSNSKMLRKMIIEILGGKCVRCGFSDMRALQIDHVKGGGTKQRKTSGNSVGMYTKMIDELKGGKTGDYQVLCANCNWIKRSENNEHNHVGASGRKWNDKIP